MTLAVADIRTGMRDCKKLNGGSWKPSARTGESMNRDDYIVVCGCVIGAFLVGLLGGYVLHDVFLLF